MSPGNNEFIICHIYFKHGSYCYTSFIHNSYSYYLSLIPQLYSSKFKINVQLVAMEKWESKDQITINDNMKETYEGFRDFNTHTLSSRHTYDSAYLLS